MRKLLTDAFIRSIKAPPAGRAEFADLRCVGLTLRVASSGVQSWSFRFRDPRSGKLSRATIGGHDVVTLAQARKRGDELRRDVAAGINPVERKRKDRSEAASRTFAALASRYVTEHARRHKRSAAADERMLRLHVLPLWGTRPFDAIVRRDVIALCEGVVAKGWPIQANRVQALISKIFSFAIDADLIGANPCARLKKRSKEVRATRVLTDDEIRLFWRRIAEPPNSARIGQALRLVLLTAVRVSELAGAEFREFDRMDDVDGATWTIPASRSKNSRAHMIPLSKPALNIVLDLVKRAEKPSVHDAKRQFLLRSPARADKPIDGHALSVAMMRFGNALNALSTKQHLGDEERRAIESWTAERPTAHDLRRTLATRLAGLGVPAEDISACLNHTRKGVTATHYDHYDRAREKRRALALWGQRVAELVSGAPSPSTAAHRAEN